MNWSPRWRIDRISAQIAIVLVLALALVHAVTTTTFVLTRGGGEARGDHPEQFLVLARLLDASSPDGRTAQLADFNRAFPRLDARWATAGEAALVQWDGFWPIGGPSHGDGMFRRGKLVDGASSGAPWRMALELREGAILLANPPAPPPRLMFGPIGQSIFFIALSTALLAAWAASALTRPLRAFEESARRFGENIEARPLPEQGPREIRAAAGALNRMQARIRALINDRTRMLAALSHDLRTPLTRLRLRAEFVHDDGVKQSILGDIAQMQAMVDAALVYLREGTERSEKRRVDLASLLQAVCNDFSDVGHDVRYDGPDHLIVLGHFDSLHRAFSNIVDNGVRYAGTVRVISGAEGDHVRVDVADRGPGVADELREAMLEPFVRGDAARGMDATSGFGLGLPIARSVIVAHGGSLTLADGTDGGLTVRILLPAAPAAEPSPDRPSEMPPKAHPGM